MQTVGLSTVAAALLAAVTTVSAQGVTEAISPSDQKAPAGCVSSAPGRFELAVVAATDHAKRAEPVFDFSQLAKRRECGGQGVLVMSLADSVAKDAQDRTAYIASNFQFQFDGPPQAGAIYTAGFSVCPNGLLALGNSTQFWQCKSGDFWNLYDRNWASHCDPVVFKALPCGSDAEALGGGSAAGAVVATEAVTTTLVRPIADGQPQVITTVVPIAMCQIGDGQVQAHTTPCASITAPLATATPVSQISDGQIQVPPPGTGVPPPAGTGVAPPAGTGVPPPAGTGVAPPAGTGAPPTTPAQSQPPKSSAPAPAPSTPASNPTGTTPTPGPSTPSAPPVSQGARIGTDMFVWAATLAGVVGVVAVL